MAGLGWFDLPGWLLHAVDRGLENFLPAGLRLVLWALVSAYATMWVYRRFSRQQELAALKPRIKVAQQAMVDYEGSFAGLRPLIADSLSLAFKQVWLSLGPALLGGIPVLFILLWISNDYGYQQPRAHSRVVVWVSGYHGDPDALSWVGMPAERISGRPLHWKLTWPEPGGRISLVTAAGARVTALPAVAPVTVLHQRRWWNTMVANPAGYIESGAAVDAVHVDLPEKIFLPAGPEWMRGWAFSYFLLMIGGSLGLKWAWGIQ